MPCARSHFGAVAWGDKIFVFGGGGEGFRSLNQVHIYDPATDAWTDGCLMPTSRSGIVAVCLDDRILVMGGGFRNPDGTFNFLGTVEIYDPKRDCWEEGPPLLQRHDAPAATVHGGRVYLMGGHHPEATGGPMSDPATGFSELLNPQEGQWQEMAPMPTPRFSLSAVSDGQRVLAMGGGAYQPDGVFRNLTLIESFDPATGQWSRKTGFSLPWPTGGVGGCLMNGRIYVVGGNNGERIDDRAACCDPGEGNWTLLPPMKSPRAAMGVVGIDQTLYVLGGRGADGKIPVNTMESFSL